tara:strand:- start:4774 stop:5532 length:759 start_codon:yes stop_codon:yes gene_type:complete
MLKARIIPCLDIKDGLVVKGKNFVDLQQVGDPVVQASIYDKQGADELCFLDITASHEKRNAILEVVMNTTKKCFMPVTVGGGVRNIEDIRNLLLAGADKVSINTAAVENPEFIKEAAKKFGSQCIVVAIDAKHVEQNKYNVFTHGGRKNSGKDVFEWAERMAEYGAGEILLTSMDRDGTKEGFDIELTRNVVNSVNIPVIASGGVGSLDHLAEGVLQGHATGVLAASIFHYGEHTIKEAKLHLKSLGVSVRI